MSGVNRCLGASAIGALLVALLAGCAATVPQTIATVEGPAVNGIVDRPLQILGVINLATQTGNVANGKDSHFVDATVEIPVGTALIVPALRGWTLAYGSAQPSSSDPDALIEWSPEDHHWGFGAVEVTVVKVNPPNTVTQPPTQTAELSLRFLLTDDNQDDPWFGSANYSLLCLGVPGVDPADWTPLRLPPPKMMIVPRPGG